MTSDQRHHMQSMLMRESLLDRDVMRSTDKTPVVRMLPNVHVVKVGSSSIIDKGRSVTWPLVEAIRKALETERLILATGGGARSRHVYSIAIDLGLPTGVLAQLTAADALGNAHILGTLLAPQGVVAIPPEIFGHLLPLLIASVPGVIFNGVPPYSLWEHPPAVGRIPPHRSDAGCFLLCETFGCKTLTLVKDVDGVYTDDPKTNPSASLIREIGARELARRNLATLPFDRILLELLERARLVDRFQVINGTKPELFGRALAGEHVGTIVHAERRNES
jgi:molybdenum storage protein